VGRSLDILGRGNLILYGYASPESYGLGGDLNLNYNRHVGIYAGARYAGIRNWQATGGLKWNW